MTSLVDTRLLLKSPFEIKVNDRLQRNGDNIRSTYELDSYILVKTQYAEYRLAKSDPVHVWRMVPND